MKNNAIVIGMAVVVSKEPNSTIYKVAKRESNFTVMLTYKINNKTFVGGVMDVSILRKPTKIQYKNWDKRR